MRVRILVGDCLELLSTLPEESVHCVVTSPPYWGLRDYGVASAIGLEPTFEEHLGTLVTVFREVRRVLRSDGTLWLNYGDCYHNGDSLSGLKPKDLMMTPARVALALQADGWWLRSEIVWHKPNPMPESVRDRPTSAHEKIYLLTKSARYFYDAEAVRVACSPNTHARRKDHERAPRKGSDTYDRRAGTWKEKRTVAEQAEIGANLRNVWTTPTHAYPDAHFATFPPKLVEPCIKAGCPVGGVVLDPFGGSGTVGLVASRLGRDAILIELNPEYAALAERRIYSDAPLLADVGVSA